MELPQNMIEIKRKKILPNRIKINRHNNAKNNYINRNSKNAITIKHCIYLFLYI